MFLTLFVFMLADLAPGDMAVVGSSHIIDTDTIIVSNDRL